MSIVLVDPLNRTGIVVPALEPVVDDGSNPGNAIDENSPVHVLRTGVGSGREEKQDPTGRQEDDGCQIDSKTPTAQIEATG